MEECLICFENLENEICLLSCNHKFHLSCIKNWISKTNSYSNICCICEKRCEIINISNNNINDKNINDNISSNIQKKNINSSKTNLLVSNNIVKK